MNTNMSDFKLWQWWKWDLYSSGILRSAAWYYITDVSLQPIVPLFKGQTVFLNCFSLEDWTESLSRNVGKKLLYAA